LKQEELNSFKVDPLSFLKSKNEQKYNEYEAYITKNK